MKNVQFHLREFDGDVEMGYLLFWVTFEGLGIWWLDDDFAYLPTYLSYPNFEMKWVGWWLFYVGSRVKRKKE